MTDWPYPRIVAHRGGGTLAPENTLEGIDTGAKFGIGMIEFDAKLAADGTVFLLHDDRVDRTSNGSGAAQAMDYATLRALDAGSWFDPRFADARMPTLEEVAARCQRWSMAANIEIKPCIGRDRETGHKVAIEAARLWAPMTATPQPLLSSFSFEALEAAALAAPDLPRGLLFGSLPPDWRAQTASLSCVSIHLSHVGLTQARVDELKAAGLRILVYTVNDPEVARNLGAWGVDAICTDRIDLIGADFFTAGFDRNAERDIDVKRRFATPIDLYRAIARVWSSETASPTGAWAGSNPAQNHCSITSLIVQDCFGGEILSTKTVGGTHFYNLIGGKRWDLTMSQFVEPVPFDDTPSTREAALADTTEEKYFLLLSRLMKIG